MISYLIIYFAVYSVLGWIYETVLCSIREQRAVNRGFLNGPYCPIYGVGAMLFLALLKNESSALIIFIFGGIIASAVEYLTSFAMEKLFDARWWDYSHYRFNLNGRICLAASLIFGGFAVALIKVIHPYVKGVSATVPQVLIIALAGAFTLAFILDLFITLRGFGNLTGTLSRQEKRLIKAFPMLNEKRK